MKRRRAEESADGIALMTSSVTSSYSADGLRKQSQESAGRLHPEARGSDVVERQSSRKLLFTSRCYLEIGIAKRCRLHKLIRQRFAIQQKLFALITSRKIQSQASLLLYIQSTCYPDASNSSIQSRAYMNQLLLLNQSQALHIQSTWFPDARKEEVAKRCIQSQDIVPVASYSALHPVDKDISRR
ncbi:hypothetical protein F511_05510 [Dorcoceras hygrometricum]|uniref:Uncharacterized protein n=1 Tax=Dorcoceras hygrometricum TaxID=472368 RepID=A0A2Z7BHJ4_9LAMI|nr:hypothetical protein F511_05510 [Dorcoceras hygrometricum]